MTGNSASGAQPGIVAGRPAPVGRRLLAALYDAPALLTLFVIGTAVLVLGNRGAPLDASALSLSLHRTCLVGLWIAYYCVGWTRFGQTLGMRVWGIRLVRLDGARVRWSQALLRLASGVIAWLPLALGVVAACWDPERRAWHDRWSRTRVLG